MKSSSLWSRVLKQKYIFGESLLEWIRNPRKSHVGGSVIWKAIVTSFGLIENHLAWDVGNGESVMIGRDPWMGSFQQHLLPPDVIDQLGLQGVISLNQLAVPRINEPWIQIWKRVVSFELGARETVILDHYIRELVRANIILSDNEDTLVWEADLGGGFTVLRQGT